MSGSYFENEACQAYDIKQFNESQAAATSYEQNLASYKVTVSYKIYNFRQYNSYVK